MASASRLTHDGSSCFLLQRDVGSSHVCTRSGRALQVVANPFDIEWTRDTQCPGKRPASLGHSQTVEIRMQPSPPPWHPVPGIRDDLIRRDYHTQQLGGQRLGTTTHTRPHRAKACGYRSLTLNHVRVYLLMVSRPNPPLDLLSRTVPRIPRINWLSPVLPVPSHWIPPQRHHCGYRSASR